MASVVLVLALGWMSGAQGQATADTAGAPLLFGDAVEPGQPNPPPVAWPRSGTHAKASAAAPSHLRWAVLRCSFAGGPPHPHATADIRRIFEKPDVGVFAFFDRHSRGLLSQQIAWTADVALPKSWSAYWAEAGGTSPFLDATTRDCLSGASRALDDITAVALFYNSDINCCSYGSFYQLPVGDDTRQISAIWMSANGSNVASIVAHEVAHSLGVRHSNNSDRDFDTTDNAWDIMSSYYRNAVRDDELLLLPHGFHPYHRQLLGWLAAEDVVDVAAAVGPDRTVEEILRPGELLRVHFDEQHGLTVHFRGIGSTDDGKRTEPAIFIDELDTTRVEPLWVVDEALPVPNVADTDTSFFTRGESWVVEAAVVGRAVMVDVVSVSADDATVRIHLGPPPQPVLVFANQFESSQEQSAHAQ